MEKNTGKTNSLSKKEKAGLISRLYLTFFKIGAFTFGGGLAMLPIMEREVVDKYKWTTRDELIDFYSIAQITPGVIAVNVATYLGYTLAGVFGSIFATLGVITPSIIIISIIAYCIDYFSSIDWVQSALSGINVAVCSLLTVTLIKFAKQGMKACNVILAIILIATSFVFIEFLKVPSSLVIIAGAVLGVVIHAVENAVKNKKKKGDE